MGGLLSVRDWGNIRAERRPIIKLAGRLLYTLALISSEGAARAARSLNSGCMHALTVASLVLYILALPFPCPTHDCFLQSWIAAFSGVQGPFHTHARHMSWQRAFVLKPRQ